MPERYSEIGLLEMGDDEGEGTEVTEIQRTRTSGRAALPSGVWIVADGLAHRLGGSGLPAWKPSDTWIMVDAAREEDALRQADAYRRSRRARHA
jgi:hypothetical protein